MRKLAISKQITNRDSVSFKMYLADIAEIETFSGDEEFECAERAVNGDESARAELIKRNLRFVISVAKQYSTNISVIEDLVNEGNIGLMAAVDRFKPNTGFKFITFAVWWIRKYITEYMEKNAKLVRLPANKIYGISKLNRKIDVLEQRLERTPDISEVIESFCDEIPENELRNLEFINACSFDSLDREISSSQEGSTTVGDLLCNEDNYIASDHLVMAQGEKLDIKRYLQVLKPKHRRIIIGFFGLDGNYALSLKELSEELGITREMVRQIKNKALIKLQETIKSSLD